MATFNHPFHMLRDDETAPNITVRVCTVGRATNKRFICDTAAHRLQWQDKP